MYVMRMIIIIGVARTEGVLVGLTVYLTQVTYLRNKPRRIDSIHLQIGTEYLV